MPQHRERERVPTTNNNNMPTISVDESAIQGLQRVMDHLLGGVSTLSASTQNSTSEVCVCVCVLCVSRLWQRFGSKQRV